MEEMESDPFASLGNEDADFGDPSDPSRISLNFNDFDDRFSRQLAVDTEGLGDSADLSSPLLPGAADGSPADPAPADGEAKGKQMSYSAFMGRAQEVAKRRNMIERLERARDRGVLVCAVPQISELTVTQLSMFLRRLFKSAAGLREFIGEGVLSHIFEDASPQVSAVADQQPTPATVQDAENATESESEQLDEEAPDGAEKPEISIRDSLQPEFYHVRRTILSADYFACSLIRTLTDKQERIKTLPTFPNFEHEKPADEFSCARCRPLVEKPKRRVFRVQNASSFYRATSPPPSSVVNERNSGDYGFENHDLRMLDLNDRASMENELQAYLNRLAQIPPHYAIKNHVAFPELGENHDFHGMLKAIRTEVSGFPYPLRGSYGIGLNKKRSHELVQDEEDDDEEDEANYPLVQKVKASEESLKRTFPLRPPPSKFRRQQTISPPKKRPEPRVTPLKIIRPPPLPTQPPPPTPAVGFEEARPRISLSIRLPPIEPKSEELPEAAGSSPRKSLSSARSSSSDDSSSSTDSDDEGESSSSDSADSAASSPRKDEPINEEPAAEDQHATSGEQPVVGEPQLEIPAADEVIGAVSSGSESDDESSPSESQE